MESCPRPPGIGDPPAGQKATAGWGGLEGGARRITYVATLLLRKVLRLSSGLCLVVRGREAGELLGHAWYQGTLRAGKACSLAAREGLAASDEWLSMPTDGGAKWPLASLVRGHQARGVNGKAPYIFPAMSRVNDCLVDSTV